MRPGIPGGMILGVTGGIACGKSTFGAYLRELDIPVLDTDEVGHRVLNASPGHERVVAAFGEGILDETGTISREKLGKIIFANSEKREHLNQIVHPLIRQEWETWVEARRANDELAAVLVPLLFERHLENEWDHVVVIAASEDIMRQRLRSRNLTDEEIEQRLASQWPVPEKIRRADSVIYNNSALSDFKLSTLNLLNSLKRRNLP